MGVRTQWPSNSYVQVNPITWVFENFIEILKTEVFIKFLSILENFWTLKNKLLDIRRVNSFRFELR